MNAMCESSTTYELLLWMEAVHNLMLPTYYLPHLQMGPQIHQFSSTDVKTYSEDIFREAWLCKHMRGSLILPMFLWLEMCFVNLLNTDMTV